MGNLNTESGGVVKALLVDHSERHLITAGILIDGAHRDSTGLGAVAKIPIVSSKGAAARLRITSAKGDALPHHAAIWPGNDGYG